MVLYRPYNILALHIGHAESGLKVRKSSRLPISKTIIKIKSISFWISTCDIYGWTSQLLTVRVRGKINIFTIFIVQQHTNHGIYLRSSAFSTKTQTWPSDTSNCLTSYLEWHYFFYLIMFLLVLMLLNIKCSICTV